MRLAIKTATLCMAMACPFAGWSQAVAVGATGSTVNTGIAPQASEPTIGPQFNQPMVGQPGPGAAQPGFPQPAEVLPPGVLPGLSDQGLIFPDPGTIAVAQGDTAVIASQNGAIGVGSVTGVGVQEQATGQDQRGIGIAPQASEPTIGPQFNQPMTGQPGPAPAQPGFPQPSQVLPGLSDQGLIFPAPGTVALGPQDDTAVIASQSGDIGVGSVTEVGVQEQATVQDKRGIGIAPQASEPTIGPQFNQPMIGQPGPAPAQPGFPQPAQVPPAGVQPGLSDQGLIFPAPGTIIVGPQGNAAVVASQSGVGSGSSIGVGAQGQDPTMAPNNIAPVMNPGAYRPTLGSRSFQPALPTNVPQSGVMQPQGVSPALTPTGRSGAGTATGTGASGGK